MIYTVSYLKRMDVRVHADSLEDAVRLACPWWGGQQPIDGSVLIGVREGLDGVKSGLDPLSGPHKPPTGPTPGAPTNETTQTLEAIAA